MPSGNLPAFCAGSKFHIFRGIRTFWPVRSFLPPVQYSKRALFLSIPGKKNFPLPSPETAQKKKRKISQKVLTPGDKCGIISLALNECHTREWWNW